jgi:hypothetical protein
MKHDYCLDIYILIASLSQQSFVLLPQKKTFMFPLSVGFSVIQFFFGEKHTSPVPRFQRPDQDMVGGGVTRF